MRRTADPRLSRSLEYGAAMLQCFAPGRTIAGVADLSVELGIGRSTAHRYAATLFALGYLEQDQQRKYRLARLALEPGLAALGAVRLAVPVGSTLAELRASSGHTVSMAVLDGTRALYVHRLYAHGAGQHAADGERRVGAALPLHCSALGKALMAALPDQARQALAAELTLKRHGPKSITSKRLLAAGLGAVRDSGIALSDEELAPQARSLAVAVPGGDDQEPLVAIDVTVPARAYTLAQLQAKLGPLVRQAATEIGQARPVKAQARARRRRKQRPS